MFFEKCKNMRIEGRRMFETTSMAGAGNRSMLGAGDRFDGPAIVEERETTAVIRPGWNVEVGPDGSLIATRTARSNTNGDAS